VLVSLAKILRTAPFAAAGQYLIPQVPTTFKPVLIAKKQDVPVNGSIVFWFPFTTDPTYTIRAKCELTNVIKHTWVPL
jgi:hypothetical protein